jgi:hypothetical protein
VDDETNPYAAPTAPVEGLSKAATWSRWWINHHLWVVVLAVPVLFVLLEFVIGFVNWLGRMGALD